MADNTLSATAAFIQEPKGAIRAPSETRRKNWANSNKRKTELLGMPAGTAMGRLRKAILYKMVCRLGENICYRCKASIDSVDDLSIEHKEPWQAAEDPVSSFFDLENISFSHFLCNVAHARRPTRSEIDSITRRRLTVRRNQKTRVASTKRWRANRRAAGLPYT